MQLDIPTLATVMVFVTTLLGALLVFAGLQNRAVRALLTWGVAFVLCAVGMALAAVRGMIPDWTSIQFAMCWCWRASGWSGSARASSTAARRPWR